MGPRNLLILFFSTVAVSLVILIIFFSLFFKNVDLNFNTRLPESAPEIGRQFNESSTMNPDSKADGLMRSTVNVPPEFQEPPASASGKAEGKDKKSETQPSDADLPPISDDAMLENDSPMPVLDQAPTQAPSQPSPDKPPFEHKATMPTTRPERTPSPSTSAAPATRPARPVERRVESTPPSVAMPEPIPDEVAQPSGPPVPGQ